MKNVVDFVDGTDTEKTRLPGDVHSVHDVYSVHYLGKPDWLNWPNLR